MYNLRAGGYSGKDGLWGQSLLQMSDMLLIDYIIMRGKLESKHEAFLVLSEVQLFVQRKSICESGGVVSWTSHFHEISCLLERPELPRLFRLGYLTVIFSKRNNLNLSLHTCLQSLLMTNTALSYLYNDKDIYNLIMLFIMSLCFQYPTFF